MSGLAEQAASAFSVPGAARILLFGKKNAAFQNSEVSVRVLFRSLCQIAGAVYGFVPATCR